MTGLAVSALPDEYLAATLSNTPPESQYEVEIDEIVVNVFFDGTMNNLFNVNAGTPDRGTSYSNAHSNISWMFQAVADKQLKVYVQGIGTLRSEKDAKIKGGGFGAGKTGLKSRALEGFKLIAEVLEFKYGKSILVQHLTLNVFGFSRGAAAARYFVSELMTNSKAFKKHSGIDSILIANAGVNFMGLFDTVSSVGAKPTNDVKTYKQQIKPGWATRVFHLIAGDEFRHYFPVTHIDTAIRGHNPFGYELQIPGAHSDIGGGYQDDEPEALRWTSDLAKGYYVHLPWWGWYREDQINTTYYPKTGLNNEYWDHWTHTRYVSNQYHRVALNIMVEITKKYVDADDLTFTSKLPVSTIYSTVQKLKDTLTAYALAGDNQKLGDTHYWLVPRSDPAWNAKDIYNRLFHFSARFLYTGDLKEIGMKPNINSEGKPYREHVHDNR